MVSPFEGIAQGIANLGEHFSNVLSYLNPFSENFLLNDLLNWLNPTSEDFILKQLWEFLTNIVSYLNPFDENFFGRKLVEFIGDLLEGLFIPEEDIFGNLQTEIQNKFQFTTQISELFETLLSDFDYGDEMPSFSITYEGVSADIIDFSPYLQYRTWLHSIILGISWFIFIRKTFYKIPDLIGGV